MVRSDTFIIKIKFSQSEFLRLRFFFKNYFIKLTFIPYNIIGLVIIKKGNDEEKKLINNVHDANF
jgi:hypothetical protein